MQGVVLQTWCGKNSTHPLSCVVAQTRRGTTTDCDHPACGKGLGSRCRDEGGHPRRHHVATARNVRTSQGRRSSEASFEHGRSASEGLRTWLRYVCMTLLVKRPTPLFQLLEPVQYHMCALPAIRAFSFFFLEVVWDGRKPALLQFAVRHVRIEHVDLSLFCTVCRGESTACGFILGRCQNFNLLVSVLSHPIWLEVL